MGTKNSGSEAFDVKEYQINNGSNKFDYDLFKDEDNIINAVYRVKRTDTPKKGERWKIFKNDEMLFEIDGAKISKKNAGWLRTIDGINWLIGLCKAGMTNIKQLKIEMKDRKNNEDKL